MGGPTAFVDVAVVDDVDVVGVVPTSASMASRIAEVSVGVCVMALVMTELHEERA